MASNPLKSKRDYMRKYAGLEQVKLNGIKDGFERTFVNDGPFPIDSKGDPVDGWRKKATQSGRAELIKKCLAREADPLKGESGNDEDALIPLFVWEGKGPAPKFWDPRIQMDVSPQPMTPHLEKVRAYFLKQRGAIMQQASDAMAQKKREAESKLDDLAGAVAGKIAAAIGAESKAKKAPGGAP
jgi:hypothetical protein